MARGLSSTAINALTGRAVQIEYLFRGEFVDSTLNLWSGFGDFSWNSETWNGNGWLHEPGSIRETAEIRANGVEVTLTGVPTTLLSLALRETRQSNKGTLYLAIFDADGDLITVDTRFVGNLDKTEIEERANGSVISLKYESRLIRLESPRERRWTNEDQKIDYPSDRGFEYVTFLRQQRIYWGRPDTTRGG